MELKLNNLWYYNPWLTYRLNLNYAIVVKQDINKLLTAGFIQPIKEVTWLSPIMLVPKKNVPLWYF
jgi:hypothetical protein